ncbi:MAG: hypothetical protein DWI10_03635 [Planctomycetota bacterium]|nr:MAG: hypothetical protein DWI10_03635 [Planctomycetota bacterium]
MIRKRKFPAELCKTLSGGGVHSSPPVFLFGSTTSCIAPAALSVHSADARFSCALLWCDRPSPRLWSF